MNELLRTDLKMIFGTKKYYITLASTVMTAIISVILIRFMAGQYQYLGSEFAAMLKSSDSFNLYVIKVKNIEDILDLTGADMMYLCFSGCFLPGVIAVFSITWITYGYKTGMIRFVITKGYARYQIVLSKFISNAVSILGIVLTYLLASAMCGSLLGGFGRIDLMEFLLFLMEQVFIYIIFSFFCMAVIYAMENEAMGIVCMISMIVALPDLLRYLKIFTNSSRDFELLWILSYSSRLALRENVPVGAGVVLLTVIFAVSIFISVSVFGGKEVK